MKYLLVIFIVTGGCSERVTMGQQGPFDSMIACESAAARTEAVVREIGAKEVGTFCAGTKEASFRMRVAK